MHTATLKYDQKSSKFQAIYQGQVVVQGNTKQYVTDTIILGLNKRAKKMGITKIEVEGLTLGDAPTEEPANDAVVEEFSINERFSFLSEVTQMVIDGTIPSAVISGEGGLGKTFSVLKKVEENGLIDIQTVEQPDPEEEGMEPLIIGDYIVVKGFSTAKGLYRTLYENSDKLIIFDDCDSIQKNDTAVNILKAALDSYDRRLITWNSENPFSDLPKCFLFTGKVIFISNLPLAKIEQPILSRSISVDLSMTIDQKIERMQSIIESGEFMPEVDDVMKFEALELINENRFQAKELSLRTLISITKIRIGDKADWRRFAKYVLINN